MHPKPAARLVVDSAAGNDCDIKRSTQHIEQNVLLVFDILTSF
jgi:hypothetical protein